MPMHNLIKYSKNFAKASGCFGNYHKDDANNNIANSKT